MITGTLSESVFGEHLSPTEARAAAREAGLPVYLSIVERRAEVESGPLAGVPFAVKDNIDVAGVPTTAACPARRTPATADATVVARLVAAGAVPVAKTNMDQFATGLVGTRSPYGACNSVYSRDHVSGGSSSGSALAVAQGTVPFSLGTDTAGSGRVPAAFNGLIGTKPTKGLVPTTGVLPACESQDCVSWFTRSIAGARAVLDVLAGPDARSPWSRPAPPAAPAGIATHMRTIAIPAGDLDLDPAHREAWHAAFAHAGSLAHLIPVDVGAFLAAARMLYSPAFVAERLAGFGSALGLDGHHLDPTVRRILLGGRAASACDVFAAQSELARLRVLAARAFVGADALLLPTTPGHPTLAEVAADPIGANVRLGTYTNMVNLLDLCAVAVPAANRPDGLPFGVQLIAPAFADRPLLDLAARWVGEPVASQPAPRARLAVVGAHLSGQPRNGDLVAEGGRLYARGRTAGGYRLYEVPGPFPRPGLVRSPDGPPAGIEVEIWDLPAHAIGTLLPSIAPPLALGQVDLDDGTSVPGFVCTTVDEDCRDITEYGGWRAWLATRRDGV